MKHVRILLERMTTVIVILITGFPHLSAQHAEMNPTQLFAMSLTELLDVEMNVFTAGKKPENIASIPASVVLIERRDISECGYRTLGEILSNVPGLFPTDDYSWDGQNFGVRGFWSGVVNRNMIILVNGVNQICDYSANFPLNRINVPVEAIDRIEIIRGPMSVIYGSGAFFGVINIITNETSEPGSTQLASLTFGSQNTRKVTLRLSEIKDDFRYVVNASFLKTGGMDAPLAKMMTHPEILHQYNLPVNHSTQNRLEEQQKYLAISGKSKHFFFDMNYAETDKEMFMSVPSFSNGSPFIVSNMNASMAYENILTPKFSYKIKSSYHRSSARTDYDWYMDNFDINQTLGMTGMETELNLHYRQNDRMNLTAGLYHRMNWEIINEVSGPSLGDPKLLHFVANLGDHTKMSTKSAYLQADFSPFSFLKLVLGGRMEQVPEYRMDLNLAPEEAYKPASVSSVNYTYNNWELIPRIAIITHINHKNIIKLLYGQAMNRPSFQQVIDDFLGIQTGLKPEVIHTYEFNYMGGLTHDLSFGINLFRNELSNLLIRDHGLNADETYYSFFSNSGRMITHGIELTLAAEPVRKKLSTELSFTYQSTEDQNQKDIATAYSPTWLGYLKVIYRPVLNISCGLTGRYVDSMLPYWDPVAQNENGLIGRRIGERVSGYISLGANIRISNIYKGLYFSLRGSNIFDNTIYYPTFTNNAWADKGTIGESRSFWMTLGREF